MRFTTIFSPDPVKVAGLPYAVATIEPRQIVAAFATEQDALDYKDLVNEDGLDATYDEIDKSLDAAAAARAEAKTNLFEGLK